MNQLENWISHWGINLDWEAKAKLREVVQGMCTTDAIVSDPETLKYLTVENKTLCCKLEHVLTAMTGPEIDTPCPSSIGLIDDSRCGLVKSYCRECWESALKEIGEDGTS